MCVMNSRVKFSEMPSKMNLLLLAFLLSISFGLTSNPHCEKKGSSGSFSFFGVVNTGLSKQIICDWMDVSITLIGTGSLLILVSILEAIMLPGVVGFVLLEESVMEMFPNLKGSGPNTVSPLLCGSANLSSIALPSCVSPSPVTDGSTDFIDTSSVSSHFCDSSRLLSSFPSISISIVCVSPSFDDGSTTFLDTAVSPHFCGSASLKGDS